MLLRIIFVVAFGWVCFITGAMVHAIIFDESSMSGVLRIDRSEKDEAPRVFLELERPLKDIMNKKEISLVVSTESYMSLDSQE